jgi:sulfofructose kinase
MPITAIDTLAAGDIFHGTFALAIAEEMSSRMAIRLASAAAALKCMVFGGRLGAPSRPEVLAALQGQALRVLA